MNSFPVLSTFDFVSFEHCVDQAVSTMNAIKAYVDTMGVSNVPYRFQTITILNGLEKYSIALTYTPGHIVKEGPETGKVLSTPSIQLVITSKLDKPTPKGVYKETARPFTKKEKDTLLSYGLTEHRHSAYKSFKY